MTWAFYLELGILYHVMLRKMNYFEVHLKKTMSIFLADLRAGAGRKGVGVMSDFSVWQSFI